MLKHGLLVALVTLVTWPPVSAATAEDPPATRAAVASCDDYNTQAKAQRTKDTRDADGDGIYCEDLPCPCLPPDPRAVGGDQRAEEPNSGGSCTKPAACSGPSSTRTIPRTSASTSGSRSAKAGHAG